MARPSLDEAWAKLRWARHHLDVLRREIEAFEQSHDYRISVDVDRETGEYVFHVHGIGPLNAEWGLRIGDCVHNARTALDYLMVRLVAHIRGVDPRDVEAVQFPIYTASQKLAESDPAAATADVIKRFRADKGVAQLMKEPVFSGYLARVEEMQPFNNANPSIWGVRRSENGPPTWDTPRWAMLPIALTRLSHLDNLDKHRVIHSAWLGVASMTYVLGTGDAIPLRTELEPPPGFKKMGSSTPMGPLEDGAEIGRWQFEAPLPSEWVPEQMEMKACFPLEVSLDEPGMDKAVLEVLPFCLWGVEAVLTIFGPVFTHGGPPLPVTAVESGS